MNIHDIKNEDLEKFLYSIDKRILRESFIEEAKKCEKRSKYYLGKGGNGKFWNGFRTTSIMQDKIIKSIIIIANDDTKSFNLEDFIKILLEKQYSIKIDKIEKEKIINIGDRKNIEIICNILDYDIPNDYDIVTYEKNKLKYEYNEFKIATERKYREYSERIEELEKINLEYKQEAIKEKKENDSMRKKFKSEIVELETINENVTKKLDYKIRELAQEKEERIKKEKEIKRIIKECENNKKKLDFEDIIESIEISNDDYKKILNKNEVNNKNINNIIELLLTENIEKYNQKEDITKMLVIEYALIKIKEMEKWNLQNRN